MHIHIHTYIHTYRKASLREVELERAQLNEDQQLLKVVSAFGILCEQSHSHTFSVDVFREIAHTSDSLFI